MDLYILMFIAGKLNLLTLCQLEGDQLSRSMHPGEGFNSEIAKGRDDLLLPNVIFHHFKCQSLRGNKQINQIVK